jgi:hypothetical protein
MDIHLHVGDPEAAEAMTMLLRLAAAETPDVAGPETTEATNKIRNDPRLLAWFVYAAGRVTNVYAHSLTHEAGGDFEDALTSIDHGVGNALRGDRREDDEHDEGGEG